MGEVVDINANQPHEVFEAICLHCVNRWYACVPLSADPMKDWECHHCGKIGGIIRTGQPLPDED